MSYHYEVVFGCFLREDTPETVLDTLRWHMGETAVYSYDQACIPVDSSFWSYYRELGGEGSWLGFPVQRGEAPPTIQKFEGGAMHWVNPPGVIAVPAAVQEFLSGGGRLACRIGHPTSQSMPIGTGNGSIQFFAGGIVTVRDGKREIWLRPEPEAETEPEDVIEPGVKAAGQANPREAGVTVPGWKSRR